MMPSLGFLHPKVTYRDVQVWGLHDEIPTNFS
jgi:hypothetical protein